MFRRPKAAAAALVALLVVGAGGLHAQQRGAVAEPERVVIAFIEAINRGDRAAALALVAEDACVGYTGSCLQAARLERWWGSDIFDVQGRIEDYRLTSDAQGVSVVGTYRSTGWTGRANYRFTVRDGRITGWDLR